MNDLGQSPETTADALALDVATPTAQQPALPAPDVTLQTTDVTRQSVDTQPTAGFAPQTTATEQQVTDASPALPSAWARMWSEITSALQTLVSAAVYATLIVTFGVQVARVDGLSMAPTLEDHDRLIVNKLVYALGDPRPGDIVMLYY